MDFNTYAKKRPETKEQAEKFLKSLETAGSQSKLSEKTGIHRRTISRWIEHCHRLIDYNINLPDGMFAKGISYLEDTQTGEQKIRWVKGAVDANTRKDMFLEAIEAMKENIPREEAKEFLGYCDEDLLSCYVLTDYHLGMLSWAGETGEDWDTDLATRLLTKWFKAAVESAPKSKTAVLAQLGDFLHYDSLDAITPTSGHVLDADTRYPKIVRAAIKSLRQIVNMLLDKHEHVHIVMAEGNHDLSSSVWLRELFVEKYFDEPRVTVDDTNHPYYAYEFGKVSLFFHHGHKKNTNKIDSVFAGMYRDIFGRTDYSYAHTGHLHHVDIKEGNLMIVEQHPTLAAKDAHAVRGGWLSKRGANIITYHKNHGEVSRSTIRPEMVM